MNNTQINKMIERVTVVIRGQLDKESNTARVCQLLDAREYLRRAWFALADYETEDNETAVESQRAERGRHE